LAPTPDLHGQQLENQSPKSLDTESQGHVAPAGEKINFLELCMVAADTCEDDHTDWPAWLMKHMSLVEAGPRAPEFSEVLEKFIKLEAKLGFPTGQVSFNGILTDG
jgi:hypothetical protein